MATMRGANFTGCGQCSDVSVVAQFTLLQYVITACGAYCAGIVSVLFVVLVLKLKKEKKMCFREAEEPFRGKWEGASQKATIQVLKKHTLENSLSYDKNKSMETSVEANEVLNDAVNQSIKSAEEGGTITKTDERDVIPDVSISVENEGNIPDTSKSNTNPAEQSVNKTEFIDNDIEQGLESKINSDETKNPQNASSENEQSNPDGIVDSESKERENSTQTVGISTGTSDEVPSEESIETNIDSPEVVGSAIVVDTDKSSDIKPNDFQLGAFETDTPIEETVDDVLHMKNRTGHTSHVIVRDSSGAELFEQGRDSVMFDPDELMVQNDNFRISQLSYN